MDDTNQLKETLAKLQQVIQNNEKNLDLLREINSPEEIAESETALAKLRQRESNLITTIAKLEGTGAVAQGEEASAAAAIGEGNIAAGKIGRDLIANNKIEWLFVQIVVNQMTALDPAEQQLRQLKERYLRNLARDCDVLRLSDLGGKQEIGQQVRLSQVYIGLNTTATPPVTGEEMEEKRPGREEQPLPALEAAAQTEYLALVGEPGGGKSTFVRQLTAWLAQAHLGDEVALAHLSGWAAGGWPFLLNLRDLGPALSAINPEGLSTEELDRQLVAAVETEWKARLEWLGGPESGRRLPDLLAQERLLLVFDGLDEVAEPLRPPVRQTIEALRRAPQMRIERIIVTLAHG